MRLTAIGLGMLLVIGLANHGRSADAPASRTIELWPGQTPPGENGTIGEEQAKTKDDGKTVTSLTNVSKPTLTVTRPERDMDTGVAIVVCPGGGYNNLAWNHEGE